MATPIAVPSGEKARAYVDFIDKGAISGTYQMRGWAIDDNSAIVAISLSVDGSFVGNASYGNSRGDVCAAYPNQVGCPNVGWTFPLDTTVIADGKHTLQGVAISADGTHASAAASFTVGNAAVPAKTPLQMSIDIPWPNSTLSGKVTFAGWAFDSNFPVRQVQVVIDASVTAYQYSYRPTASYGSARPDVCAAFLNAKNCLTSGWTLPLDTSTLGNGPHTVTVTAQAFDGNQRSMTATFTVANTSSVKAYIDQPAANTGPLSGSVLLSGWALDVGLPIGAVQLVVDGDPYYTGNVTIGGYRPDVCVVYPSSPDCPRLVGPSCLIRPNSLTAPYDGDQRELADQKLHDVQFHNHFASRV